MTKEEKEFIDLEKKYFQEKARKTFLEDFITGLTMEKAIEERRVNLTTTMTFEQSEVVKLFCKKFNSSVASLSGEILYSAVCDCIVDLGFTPNEFLIEVRDNSKGDQNV